MPQNRLEERALAEAAEAARDEALEMGCGKTVAQAVYHAVKAVARKHLAPTATCDRCDGYKKIAVRIEDSPNKTTVPCPECQ